MAMKFAWQPLESVSTLLTRLSKEMAISREDRPAAIDSAQAKLIWCLLCDERRSKLRDFCDLIPDFYLKGLSELDFANNHIPSLSYINNFMSTYGWSAVWNLSLTEEEYFLLTAQRVFPITLYCRGVGEIDRSRKPDIVHDLWGHLPTFCNPDIGNLIAETSAIYVAQRSALEYGLLRQKFIEQDGLRSLDDESLLCGQETMRIRRKIAVARFYLFTVEFGIIRQNTKIHVYGGGIFSSSKELTSLVKQSTSLYELTIDAIKKYDFSPFDAQKRYFTLPSVSDAIPIVKRLAVSDFGHDKA